ncbi:DUF421 domain-containing protein [Paenibacillus nasutitermitis]|uniref:DUF421 domain-containing protein n=1 Tax=Paenibacillus nasutitermitis TaxID=1652958 RepID=A0A916ZBU5_9BACL|nr:DUF421 domain-containing protein [Paenibacillus nasutitermitis]GGD87033.1 DUF421 domain-containing protein [Paenibacillus nasutitermitis]
MDYIYIAVKLITAFAGLWIMTRLLGKKEISQLTPFDFISSLMLSELVGNTIYDREVHYGQLLFALALWMVLSLSLEKMVELFPRLSTTLSGRPDIIIRGGRIDEKAMKRNNLDVHQIGMLLREQEVFSLRDVAYAIFETNGNLSVLKTSAAESVTRGDLKLPPEPVYLSRILIDKGFIEKDELHEIGRDEGWLIGELQAQGINRVADVLYAEWSEDGGLYVQRK